MFVSQYSVKCRAMEESCKAKREHTTAAVVEIFWHRMAVWVHQYENVTWFPTRHKRKIGPNEVSSLVVGRKIEVKDENEEVSLCSLIPRNVSVWK